VSRKRHGAKLSDGVTITISKSTKGISRRGFDAPLTYVEGGEWRDTIWVGSMDGINWVEIHKPKRGRKMAWTYMGSMVTPPTPWREPFAARGTVNL